MRLSTLWAAVSSAAQSVLGHLPVEVFQVDVVGEMVVKYQEQMERWLYLETSGSRVYDLILGPTDDWVHPVGRLEEAIGRLQAMHDEHWALQNSATKVWDMVLKRSDEASSLVAALFSIANLIKGCVDAVVVDGVHWGAQLALTVVLSHFPELEPELLLLGSGYNADLTVGQLDAF
jgi:hypothetical protein